jgi:alpha-mannosidase
VLLNQFHDILPGSSIGAVYDDSDRDFAAFFDRLALLRGRLAAALGGPLVANPSGWARGGLVAVDADGPVTLAGRPSQTLHAPDGTRTEGAPVPPVPPLGAARVAVAPGTAASGAGGLSVGPDHLENADLRAGFDGRGRLVSLICKRSGREALAGPANRLTAFRDLPAQYDAWDLDIEDQAQSWEVDDLQSATVVERGPYRAALRLEWRYESSRIVQIVSLAEGGILEFDTCIDWAERNTMLKAAFPLDLRTDRSVAEIQFGHVTRPSHANTSWDSARFEAPKHRWVAMAEPDFGVALMSDCKHGHDASGATLRLTLLRAPTWPWDGADIGRHRFRYGLMPFAALAEVPPAAEAFDAPLSVIGPGPIVAPGPSLASIADPGTRGVVPEALKRAEDGGDLILRLVEREGRRQEITLALAPEIRTLAEADLLEAPLGPPCPSRARSG